MRTGDDKQLTGRSSPNTPAGKLLRCHGARDLRVLRGAEKSQDRRLLGTRGDPVVRATGGLIPRL